MSPALISILLALVGGVGVAMQAPTNAALSRAGGSVVLAALISFAVGTVILATIWLSQRSGNLSDLKTAPAWAWVGGAYGAYFVCVAAFVAPRLGLGAMLTLMIAGQLIAALLLDHFGLLGLPRHPATLARVAGVMLVLAGVVLVRRS